MVLAGRTHGTLVSVNVGGIREIEWRGQRVRTGIWKSPVGDHPIRVEGVNLAGDDQADRSAHGGPDKAVYAYAVEDYEHWRASAGLVPTPGLFGENLTVQGFDLRAAVVGERWRVGTVLLEVAQPRLPCVKLGLRLDDVRFPRRFLEAGRLGAYLRILEPGTIRAGDTITRLDQPTHDVTLAEVAAALNDDGLARQLLGTPSLAESWRRMLRRRAAGGPNE